MIWMAAIAIYLLGFTKTGQLLLLMWLAWLMI